MLRFIYEQYFFFAMLIAGMLGPLFGYVLPHQRIDGIPRTKIFLGIAVVGGLPFLCLVGLLLLNIHFDGTLLDRHGLGILFTVSFSTLILTAFYRWLYPYLQRVTSPPKVR